MFVHKVKLTRAGRSCSSVNHQSPAAHLHSSVIVLQLCRIRWSLHTNKHDIFYPREAAYSTDYHSCVCLSHMSYRGVTLEDDLSHEVCVKHNHGQIGEPREEVADTQPPQLPRHLSRTHRHMPSYSCSLPTLRVNANSRSRGMEEIRWILGNLCSTGVQKKMCLYSKAKKTPQ